MAGSRAPRPSDSDGAERAGGGAADAAAADGGLREDPGRARRAGGAPSSVHGLWFEDFAVGDVHVSKSRTLCEADVAAFAGLSGDFNPLHTDEEYARATPFRGRIAHGLLVQSIASGLANQTLVFDGTTAAVQEMLIRYRAPARAGDTIHIELTVRDKDPQPGPKRGWVRFSIEVKNQRGDVVSDGEWLMLMLRRRIGPR